MYPLDFWLLYDDFCVEKGVKSKNIAKDETKRLKALFDLPEARPSKAIKVKNGD